jgi:hypothetical protein
LCDNCAQLLQFGKTCQARLAPTLDEISRLSFVRFESAGRVTSRGEFLTLSISDWPSDGSACSLSQILEANVPVKYFLNPRAAAGILRRAEKRGKTLPAELLAALQMLADKQEGTGT